MSKILDVCVTVMGLCCSDLRCANYPGFLFNLAFFSSNPQLKLFFMATCVNNVVALYVNSQKTYVHVTKFVCLFAFFFTYYGICFCRYFVLIEDPGVKTHTIRFQDDMRFLHKSRSSCQCAYHGNVKFIRSHSSRLEHESRTGGRIKTHIILFTWWIM